MRFNIVAVLALIFLMALMALALAIGGSLNRHETVDLPGVSGGGRIFEIEIDQDNCLKLETAPGEFRRFCPDDADGGAAQELTTSGSQAAVDQP